MVNDNDVTPQSDGQFWTPFKKGIATGALVVALVVGFVLLIRMDTASCMAWGHKGEVASCRVKK